MDVNEVDSVWTPPDVGEAGAKPSSPAVPGILRSTWRGTVMGFLWAILLANPLVLGLAAAAFGAGSGRGGLFAEDWLVLTSALPLFVGVFVIGLVCGMVFGALTGFFGALIRLACRVPGAVARSFADKWPIRPMPNTQSSTAPLDNLPAPYLGRRWPLLLGVLVLLVLTASFGTGAFVRRMVDRRLAVAISAADRDDPFWRLDDLMAHRAQVPDAENSALVMAEVISLIPKKWPSGLEQQGGESPAAPTEAQQAFDRLTTTAENVRLDEATTGTVHGELTRYPDAVPIARTLAGFKRGRHELKLKPNLYETFLPETQAARTVARLLKADAAIRAHYDDVDGALDSCRAILRAGRSIGDEPFVISQLVRIAIDAVAKKSALRVLGQGEPSDVALARLQAVILDELAQPILLHGSKGERAVFFEMIRRVGAGEVPISALAGEPIGPAGPRDIIARGGKLVFDYQRAVGLEWSNEVVAIARQPATAQPALWKEWQNRRDKVKTSWNGPYVATLPLLQSAVLAAAAQAYLRYQCELGTMAVLIAAERHRRNVGNWPESVAAIDPGILPEPPIDPFSGKAYRMEHHDGQLFVYSIGPNRIDEHGSYDVKRYLQGGPDDVNASAWDVSLRRQPPVPVADKAPAGNLGADNQGKSSAE